MRTNLLPAFLTVVSIVGTACGAGVAGSAFATGPSTPDGAQPQINPASVSVIALYEPTGMQQVGVIEAHSGIFSLDKLIGELQVQAARIGGTLAKIDEIKTTSHTETQFVSESYNCGTAQSPQTCTRMVTRTVVVYITNMVGRAFR